MPLKNKTAISGDGVPIFFGVKGCGEVTLLFVHGWCCDHEYWTAQMDYFATTYTVVALDVAGHGASGTQRKKWTVPSFGKDIVAVMDHLSLQSAVLIGHSAGGQWIVEAARHRPKGVIGLVGVDTWHDVEQVFDSIKITEMMKPFRSNFREAAREHAREMFLPTSDAGLVKRVVDAMSEAPSNIAIDSREEALRTYSNLPKALSDVKAPKYAINSKDFRRTSVLVARRYGIEVLLISGCGHFIMLEKPAEFDRLLGEVVARIIAMNTPKSSVKK